MTTTTASLISRQVSIFSFVNLVGGNKSLKFALKCEKHPKWLKPTEKIVRTRIKPNKYIQPFAMTSLFEKSPLPYLTNLLNLH